MCRLPSLLGETGVGKDLVAEEIHARSARAQRTLVNFHILRVLEQAGWRIRGAEGAAEVLGLSPTTLESRMTKLGIRRPS